MPRFFCPIPLSPGQTISLPEAVAHHIHVLRLRPGASITLFNGEGGEYAASLTTVEKRRATATVTAHSNRDVELAHAITLAQALPEGTKMDWIIEKAVELGASAIQPLAAQRCVVRLTSERAPKKLQHWQGIAIAATEQCGRNRVPRIADLVEFTSWLGQPSSQPRILLTPRAELKLTEWARQQSPQALTLVIGPEGGFTEQEEMFAKQAGAIPLSIGTRVLRTETAGMAALAALNALWGEM